ncbi:MAG: FMN-binding protein [Tissierellia bacterium]|nr:FMN-binding protein [Tissierellia bacterium]
MKKVLLIVVVFALSFGFLTLVNNMGSVDANTAAVQEETLSGTAKGFGGDINVTVVVKGDTIVSVEAEGSNETPGIGTMAIDELPNLIVEANSVEVDAVAGATLTSEGIKEAVKNALATKGASGESQTLLGTARGFGGDINVTVVVEGDNIVSVEAEGADETPGIGTMAIDELPNLIVEANSVEVDAVAGATLTSEGIKEAVKIALESK